MCVGGLCLAGSPVYGFSSYVDCPEQQLLESISLLAAQRQFQAHQQGIVAHKGISNVSKLTNHYLSALKRKSITKGFIIFLSAFCTTWKMHYRISLFVNFTFISDERSEHVFEDSFVVQKYKYG